MYLNVDLGEEIRPNLEIEKLVMPYIDACNIACGGYAGDVDTIRKTMKLAQQYKVLCGAHPSYPDHKNFGRIKLNITHKNLKKSILAQIQLFRTVAHELNVDIHHIKMHGALYNESAHDKILAATIIDIIKKMDSRIILFVPPKSVLATLAIESNITIHYEVFGDRSYNDDLSLVNRHEEGALIINKEKLRKHLQPILQQNAILTNNKLLQKIEMQTICMHSDHEGAIENIKYLANQLRQR